MTTSTFTQDYMVYLILVAAFAFLVLGFAFKHNYLFMISGGAWIIDGIFFMSSSTGKMDDPKWIFGIFCILIAIPSFLSIYWMREKKEPDVIVPDKPYVDRIDERVAKFRKARSRGKYNTYN